MRRATCSDRARPRSKRVFAATGRSSRSSSRRDARRRCRTCTRTWCAAVLATRRRREGGLLGHAWRWARPCEEALHVSCFFVFVGRAMCVICGGYRSRHLYEKGLRRLSISAGRRPCSLGAEFTPCTHRSRRMDGQRDDTTKAEPRATCGVTFAVHCAHPTAVQSGPKAIQPRSTQG